MSVRTAVVILNWNGKHHLKRFLPLLLARTQNADMVVADGNSSDGSVAWLNAHHPTVRVIQLEKNFGFAGGYNAALEQVEADIFVLLNSDVEVLSGWLEPLVEQLTSDEKNGACQPKIRSYQQNHLFEHAGAAGGFMDKYGFPFCRGRIFATFEEDLGQYDDLVPIFWATGTCLAIKRVCWEKAGGFDADLFAHMEEIDLCWRIQRAGYKVHAIPVSTVLHVGGGTLPYKHPRKTLLNFRNSLVVLTKNAPGPLLLMLVKRFTLDGIAAWKFLFEGNPLHFLAVVKAHLTYILWLPATLKKRRALKAQFPAKWATGTYSKSIAWAHFLQKKKKFSELDL